MPNAIQQHRTQPRQPPCPQISGVPVLLAVTNPLKTSAWKKYSKWRLLQHPFCATCGKLATATDHIIPWVQRMDLFMEPLNHQSLCQRCHSQKTVAEDGGFGKESS